MLIIEIIIPLHEPPLQASISPIPSKKVVTT